MSAPSGPAARTKRNGPKTLLGGVGLLIVVGVALAATNTLYVWAAVLGAVFVVAGVVMIAMKK